MSKSFRVWDVDQSWLLPPSVHKFVPPGRLAHFVRDTVRETTAFTLQMRKRGLRWLRRTPNGALQPRQKWALRPIWRNASESLAQPTTAT